MVRNKFYRWLIVIANCLIALIVIPIYVPVSTVHITYENIRYKLGIDFGTAFGWFMEGLKIAYEANQKLIKTGELTAF